MPNHESPQHDPVLVHRWTVTVIAALALILTLIIATVLLVHGEQNPAPRPIVQVVHNGGSGTVEPVDYLSVSPGIKPGSDGKLHDAYSQTTFYVHPGKAVKLVINNTDTVPHGIYSPGAGVNLKIMPGTHTYTLMVKAKGHFMWHCDFPCDPFSMANMGFMMGTIVSA